MSQGSAKTLRFFIGMRLLVLIQKSFYKQGHLNQVQLGLYNYLNEYQLIIPFIIFFFGFKISESMLKKFNFYIDKQFRKFSGALFFFL